MSASLQYIHLPGKTSALHGVRGVFTPRLMSTAGLQVWHRWMISALTWVLAAATILCPLLLFSLQTLPSHLLSCRWWAVFLLPGTYKLFQLSATESAHQTFRSTFFFPFVSVKGCFSACLKRIIFLVPWIPVISTFSETTHYLLATFLFCIFSVSSVLSLSQQILNILKIIPFWQNFLHDHHLLSFTGRFLEKIPWWLALHSPLPIRWWLRNWPSPPCQNCSSWKRSSSVSDLLLGSSGHFSVLFFHDKAVSGILTISSVSVLFSFSSTCSWFPSGLFEPSHLLSLCILDTSVLQGPVFFLLLFISPWTFFCTSSPMSGWLAVSLQPRFHFWETMRD